MFAVTFIVGFLLASVNGQGSISVGLNSDKTSRLSAMVPLGGSDSNKISAFGSISQPSGDITKGLALENARGHGLAISHGTTSFGEQLKGEGRLNLINQGNHKLDANAFLTRNMPTKFEGVPNYNTMGGNLDYMFKDKIGASIGAARTPFLDRTDLSAMGKLNIFRSPSSSLDFGAGLQKTITPQFTQTQPFSGFSFKTFFKRRNLMIICDAYWRCFRI